MPSKGVPRRIRCNVDPGRCPHPACFCYPDGPNVCWGHLMMFLTVPSHRMDIRSEMHKSLLAGGK